MSYDYDFRDPAAGATTPQRDRPEDKPADPRDGSGHLDPSDVNAALVQLLDKVCDLQRDFQRQSARHLRQALATHARQFDRALATQAEQLEQALRFHAEQAEQAYQRGYQHQAWQKWAIVAGGAVIVFLVALVFLI